MSESTNTRSARNPRTAEEAPVADEASATTEPPVVLGVVVAPGLARDVTAKFAAELADDLLALDTGVDCVIASRSPCPSTSHEGGRVSFDVAHDELVEAISDRAVEKLARLEQQVVLARARS